MSRNTNSVMKTFDYLQTEKAYKKLIAYRDKNGFIRVECQDCHTNFICSGQCLSKRKELYLSNPNSGCLCERCDFSEQTQPSWFKLCDKGDEVKTLVRLLSLKKWKGEKEPKRK